MNAFVLVNLSNIINRSSNANSFNLSFCYNQIVFTKSVQYFDVRAKIISLFNNFQSLIGM